MIEQIVGILLVFFLGIIAYRNKGKLFPEEKQKPVEEIKNEVNSQVNGRPLPKLIDDVNQQYRPSHTGGRPPPKRKR
jgi:hypothetical protein